MASGPETVRVTSGLAIPVEELTWRFTRSSGPGGQHANKADTRVELRFDVAASPSLGPRQRARLIDRLGPEVRVVVSTHRSQARNRAEAIERLSERLGAALRPETPRRATKPTRSSVRRRLDAKRRQGERKANRRSIDPDH